MLYSCTPMATVGVKELVTVLRFDFGLGRTGVGVNVEVDEEDDDDCAVDD